MSNYTVYHLHSDLSNGVTNIDSVTKFAEYVDYAKSLGMTALGFSEHGCIFQHIKKKETIEKPGMKYIHGEEFYLTESLEPKQKDNYHVVIMAKNYEGFLELNKLSSIAFSRSTAQTCNAAEHFYYVPRITMNELEGISDNLICTSACLGGILSKGNESLKERFVRFLVAHKDNCFLEVQHHSNARQVEYNKYLYELSQHTGLRLIAGTDTHCLNDAHAKGRAILQKAKGIFFADEEGWDLTFKTYDELVACYEKQGALPKEVYLQAIENTNLLPDMVTPWEIDRSYKYPHLWENPESLFLEKIKEGIERREIKNLPNYSEYRERILYEIEGYKHNGAVDFMLLMTDIVSWCKEHDILLGYGRGSVNGSVIAWLLGITEMDSVKYNLNFERFMSKERVSLSDIDSDLPPSRREEVKDYLFAKDGLYCCDIITFNTIALRGAIRDVARALEIPLNEVDGICNLAERDIESAKEKYPELFEYVDIVNGTIVSVGTHPCGCVTSPFTIDDSFGVCTTATSSRPVSQIYMKEIDSLNYVKLDLLALDTIELINNTCKLANIDRLTPDNIRFDDDKVWDSIRDDTTLIFQWESDSAQAYIKQLFSERTINKMAQNGAKVDKITLFSIGNGAIRPAGASYRNQLAKGEVHKTGCLPIDEFLADTSGFLIFQCQIIGFLHKFCGFTMGEADIVRRGFAKKTGTEQFIPVIVNGGYIKDGNTHYINGFIQTMKDEYGMKHEEAERTIVDFIKVIEDASSYLFSLNHSQPYSMEGYVSGYLRYYYPLEFLTTAFNIHEGDENKTNSITRYANKRNIKIMPIKFRHSSDKYTCDKSTNTIYKSISSVKFLNSTVATALYNMRGMHFDSFVDFLKVNPCNTRQTEILIRLDFFSEFGKSAKLLEIRNLFQKFFSRKDGVYVSKKSIKKTAVEPFGIERLNRLCDKETPSAYQFTDLTPLIAEYAAESIKDDDISPIEKIESQLEYLGYIQATGKEQDRRIGYVQAVYPSKRKSDGAVWAYNLQIVFLGRGKTSNLTVYKKAFDADKIKKGNIINATQVSSKEYQGKKYWYLIDYDIVS
jgi:DNA polymerase-3 subunit alpha